MCRAGPRREVHPLLMQAGPWIAAPAWMEETGDKIMLEPPHSGTLWFMLTRHQKQESSPLKACAPGATIK